MSLEALTTKQLAIVCKERNIPDGLALKSYMIKRIETNGLPPPNSKYNTMKADQLKKLCTSRNMSKSGIKIDLMWALHDDDLTIKEYNTISYYTKTYRKLKSYLNYLKSPEYETIVKTVQSFEVKNAVGTTIDVTTKSWIRLWATETGCDIGLCSISNCNKKAEVGGHMIYKYNKRRHYIVPICKYHNSSKFNDTYSFLKDKTKVLSMTKLKHRSS